MKRMSEVFELPVEANQVYISQNIIEREGLDETAVRDLLAHAAHAINHVDALADALASLLEAYFSNGRVTTDDAACALKVLKSYVGDDK